MKKLLIAFSSAFIFLTACQGPVEKNHEGQEGSTPTEAKPNIVAHKVNYADGATQLIGYASYDTNAKNRPIVLIVPEWWGITDYVESRAKQLADSGYVAMVVDMYGDGKVASTPDSAGKLAMPFYTNLPMAQARFHAALEKAKTIPQGDPTKVVAIGYCFGGAQVLNIARLGEDLKGVVSFHGNLVGATPDKSKLKAEILALNGEADGFISKEEIQQFKHEMDSIGAKYTFINYPGAKHAFTNPAATETGKNFKLDIAYNEEADKASWAQFMDFLKRVTK